MALKEMVSLGLIYPQPCHAYAIDAFLKVIKFDQWANISRASVYNTLKQLESEGYLTVKTEKLSYMPERKVYTITERGKQRLLDEIKEIVLHPRLGINAFILAMLFCFGMPAEEATEMIEKRISLLKDEVEKIQADYSEAEKRELLNWMYFLDAGIKRRELEIETAKKFIKLFQETPDFYEKKVSEFYRYIMQPYIK